MSRVAKVEALIAFMEVWVFALLFLEGWTLRLMRKNIEDGKTIKGRGK